MKYIRRSADRGAVNLGWLESKHSFSFGSYHDPKHMGVSALRVINDDMVMPGQGFGTHGHRDMEIISYVTEGALKHEDSEGNKHIVPAGDVQRMSAGSGVMHSEFNPSDTDKVKFFQIWIQPNKMGIKPSYEQKTIPQNGQLTPLVTATGENGTLSLNQDASLSRLVLKQNDTFNLTPGDYIGYLHLVKGQLNVAGESFSAGDAFAMEPKQAFELQASSDVEALWFELPAAR
ncbi:pirin family protein [Rheinheimera sp. MMS21-TC3]|uniref:pirin family protein n=1 Tax=Rheinheimera sp. MMS21-TC3 TaxID=3072790 RepID=UPI0028C40935|nr:pirin family protein [Rheinheimera sp. MMS21-TC3]WNO62101.1 pirin family protein [Rheinheimera sp. MMS21-TC3]